MANLRDFRFLMNTPRHTMVSRRVSVALVMVAILLGVGWVGTRGSDSSAKTRWIAVSSGVWRSPDRPAAWLLADGDRALQVGSPSGAGPSDPLPAGVRKIDVVLLTHSHRDACSTAPAWIAAGVPVRAPRASEARISPEGVAAWWDASLPEFRPEKPPGLRDRSFGVWDDRVLAAGIAKVDCSLADGERITFGSWTIDVVAAPGPTRDHVAFVAKRSDRPDAPSVLFCGSLIASPGKIPAPYTTDWHHCFNDGLDATVASLRKLEPLGAGLLCPTHGPPIEGVDAVRAACRTTADAAEEAGRLKSYEWYTKQRVGDPPAVKYLAPDQVATAGEKPWSQISPHLFLTGNTYALVSQDGPVLLIDPFGEKIAEQVRRLLTDRNVGPVETVLISHAHNDHYTGVFQLPDRDRWQIWTLDSVAEPLSEPFRRRAPYLDPRPLRIDRKLHDGDPVRWREYVFRVRRFPGQSEFTMGLELTIDGNRCFHTADNFFHADQFTGSGGWSGRNRSWPDFYAESAERVLAAKPDWILAEHGGPFEFHTEDFRRRVAWAKAAGRAADALSPTGRHRFDWDPHRIAVEPMRVRASDGGAGLGRVAAADLIATNPLDHPDEITVTVESPHATMPALTVRIPAQSTVRHPLRWTMRPSAPSGRVIVPFSIRRPLGEPNGTDRRATAEDPADVFAVVDVP